MSDLAFPDQFADQSGNFFNRQTGIDTMLIEDPIQPSPDYLCFLKKIEMCDISL